MAAGKPWIFVAAEGELSGPTGRYTQGDSTEGLTNWRAVRWRRRHGKGEIRAMGVRHEKVPGSRIGEWMRGARYFQGNMGTR
ncbi:hypothetical protein E2562_027195 [Oryza meyeriana var. granulata]|uniref:Uncharacterized protein n=1 Tax=Oryza meyeriana var. granulata TaxID=110450 RepID=A0A6G1EZF2_9ORYZ|nr:hypothetical protein E2562_027195 [Oryza meyeriana var. granulata]